MKIALRLIKVVCFPALFPLIIVWFLLALPCLPIISILIYIYRGKGLSNWQIGDILIPGWYWFDFFKED